MNNLFYRRSIKDGGKLVELEGPIPVAKRMQVLVRMKAASINQRDGYIGAGKNFMGSVPDDMIPLSDGAGIVEAVGEGVTLWKVGDRIASVFRPRWVGGDLTNWGLELVTGTNIDGVLTRYQTFDETAIVGIPEHLDWREAATLPCAAVTAWSALNGPSPVAAGQTVLTLGTGGVSIFAMQFALAAGACVILTSSSSDKMKIAKSKGVHHVINYKEVPDWQAAVLEITEGRGVDHVVETSGPDTISRSVLATKGGGQVHLIGTRGTGTLDVAQILRSRVTIRSVGVGSQQTFDKMNSSISLHKLRPIIDRVFPFSKAEDAMGYLKSGSHFGKVVIDID